MNSEESRIRARMKAPKVAATAGIVFSVLLIISLVLLLQALPSNPRDSEGWLATQGNTLHTALTLVPFAGIAVLWFMGVVFDRLGDREDRFIVTVFLGSGLLFLILLFTTAAVAGSVVLQYSSQPNRPPIFGFYEFGDTLAREILNVYMVRMMGVFMISTSTLFIRNGIIPRWIAWLGFTLALIMVLRLGQLERIAWIILAFPAWVLLVSIYILIDNYRKKSRTSSTEY